MQIHPYGQTQQNYIQPKISTRKKHDSQENWIRTQEQISALVDHSINIGYQDGTTQIVKSSRPSIQKYSVD